jgi:2-hydroxychromene-2-carboxylate isomerase
MGDLVSLNDHRAGRAGDARRAGAPRAMRSTFWFDLALPDTYLAAERVDRNFTGVRWQPVAMEAFYGGDPFADAADRDAAMSRAAERADFLAMPLVWPETFPSDVRPAMRAASVACRMGRGAPFVLAASRLAFCGGFDLGHPEVLAEAAAAADVPLSLCLEAAGDEALDGPMEAEGRRLLSIGVDRLPALRVGRSLFPGEDRLGEAIAAVIAAG